MCRGKISIAKYMTIAAIALLPKLSLSCDNYNMNTTIPGPPVMTELKSQRTIYRRLYTGTFTSLQCCTSGNPSPIVTWYKNKYKIDLSNFKLKLTDNNQTLWIQSVKLTDSGLYSCQASNNFGNQSRQFRVRVTSSLVLQKPVVILEPNSWSAIVTSNVTLNCIVKKSIRRPMIVWHFNSTATRPLHRYTGRHLVKTTKMDEEESWNSNLTIFNVTEYDEGPYFCVARNGAGSGKAAQDSGLLTVINEPVTRSPLPPYQDKSTGMDQKSILTVLTIAFIGFVILIITIVFLLWRRRKHSGSSALVFNHRQTDNTNELDVLIIRDGTNPCEIPHKNLQLLRQQAGDTQCDFDVFISYSSQDRDFVKKVLFEELSTTHSVCIDFKDFEIGTFIGDNIINSIVKSRKTLLVVSKNFLAGDWTYFEMQIAQGRLEQGHDVLIPVIIEDISFNDLPKPLQHYRQTKTYLEYFNHDVKPHFWDRLRSAIGKSLIEDEIISAVTKDDAEMDETKIDDSKIDNSKKDGSKIDDSKIDDSKKDDSKKDDSKADDSKIDKSKTDDSKIDNSKIDASKIDNSKIDASKIDNSKIDDSKMIDTSCA